MAGKSGSEIINVLVLGTSDVKILQFVKLFGVYLQHDSYEESKMWQTNSSILNEDINDITTSIVLVGNKKIKFVCIPRNKYVHKQIVQFMIFMQRQKLNAIIFLVKQSEREDIWVYKSCLFSKLKDFQHKNILNIVSLNTDCYSHEKYMDNAFPKERSEFYFEEDRFYSISKDSWQQNVDFSKKILKCITEDYCGLQDCYFQSVVSEESLLKLERDLLELLILIYISAEFYNPSYDDDDYYGFQIKNYKKNITTCYGNNCVKWIENQLNKNYKMKIPKICHGPCKCTESLNDVSKCMTFGTFDKICLQCNCSSYFHSKNYFDISPNYYPDTYLTSIKNEKHIAINNLATFFLHNQQNQEINFEEIFLKLINEQDTDHQTIFNNFKKEFNDEVQKLENNSNPITCENVLMCIKELYQIEKVTAILPRFIAEKFPEDFEVEVIADDANGSNKEARSNVKSKFKSEKMENELLRKENAELKLMVQNANDLIAKLMQDMHDLTKQHKINQTGEKSN